jgi:hypothetical protein
MIAVLGLPGQVFLGRSLLGHSLAANPCLFGSEAKVISGFPCQPPLSNSCCILGLIARLLLALLRQVIWILANHRALMVLVLPLFMAGFSQFAFLHLSANTF